MIVMKFGGTSVRDADAIRTVTRIVAERVEDRPVVVVSAHAGVTDELIALATRAVRSRVDIGPLRERHKKILGDLELDADPVTDLLDELASLLTGISLVGELTARSRDYIMSFGEQLSSRIVAAAFRQAGMESRAWLAWDLGLVTDSHFGSANVRPESRSRIAQSLAAQSFAAQSLAAASMVPVVTGFIAKDRDGNITTLGRSGSDYTASIIGAAIGAEEIQIWTDVSGVMTADPRIVPAARSIPRLSFAEMSELAYYGAKVIHPATMVPAVDTGIPVRVKNTHEPSHPGTVIEAQTPDEERPPITSIASKSRLTLINVVSQRMLLQHGFMAKLFDVFGRHEVVVDMISTSEVSVSITTDSEQDLRPVVEELSAISEVTSEREQAIVCLVGDGIRRAPGTVARVFKTMHEAGVTTRMISMGATKINVSLLVADAQVESAVAALHREFFEG